MINRILIRIKVIQLLYAWRTDKDKQSKQPEQELILSLENTYELYHWLLQLIVAIHEYAVKRIEMGLNKLRPSEEERNPNKRFINNKFSKQLAANKDLKAYVEDRGINWEEHADLLKILFNKINEADFFQDYMKAPSSDYANDKLVWRQIFKKVLIGQTDLEERLEDLNLYWNDDLETVFSFIDKTIKRFDEAAGADQALLPKYRDPEDEDFAVKLFLAALKNRDEYDALITQTAKNWEVERIATMDMVIMEAAIAELTQFPSIPISVTLNEYIENSKFYSTDKSSNFVNGILDQIISQLKAENKLIKVGAFVK